MSSELDSSTAMTACLLSDKKIIIILEPKCYRFLIALYHSNILTYYTYSFASTESKVKNPLTL